MKVVLRADIYLRPLMNSEIKSSNNYYCDACFPHDLIAICSLILGVRLKAGGRTREFRYSEDPLGIPINHSSVQEEQAIVELDKILLNNRHLIMPSVVSNTGNLEKLKLLDSIPKLSLEEAVDLIKSARLYQDAIWIGESEPQRAWILLVSALENCAQRWENTVYSAKNGLIETYPKLANYLLDFGGEEHLNKVADYLSDRFKLAQNFVDFVVEFLSKSTFNPLSNYNDQKIKKIFKKIYHYRSKFLHAGTPFPTPMCEPPSLTTNSNGEKIFSEKGMNSLAVHTSEGTWLPEEAQVFMALARRNRSYVTIY